MSREADVMWKHFVQFCRDEDGFVMATEWVVIATILMLGAAAGLVTARAAVLADFDEVTISSR
jgi:Flp pilus assembly pilin Flp